MRLREHPYFSIYVVLFLLMVILEIVQSFDSFANPIEYAQRIWLIFFIVFIIGYVIKRILERMEKRQKIVLVNNSPLELAFIDEIKDKFRLLPKKKWKMILLIPGVILGWYVTDIVEYPEKNPFYFVASGSMVPVLNVNDLIVVWGKDNNTSFDSAKVGDIIVFKAFIAEPGEKEGKTIVHRVASVFEEGETLRGNAELNQLCYPVSVPAVLENKTILTKGDANECSIPGVDIPITKENYVGKVISVIPFVGIITPFLKSLAIVSPFLTAFIFAYPFIKAFYRTKKKA